MDVLRQVAASTIYVGDGVWVSGSVFTNPSDGTVLVDTGPLPASNYLFALTGACSADCVLDIEHRDTANVAIVDFQRRRPRAGDLDMPFPNKIRLNANERVRVVLRGNLTGEVQCSLWYQGVL